VSFTTKRLNSQRVGVWSYVSWCPSRFHPQAYRLPRLPVPGLFAAISLTQARPRCPEPSSKQFRTQQELSAKAPAKPAPLTRWGCFRLASTSSGSRLPDSRRYRRLRSRLPCLCVGRRSQSPEGLSGRAPSSLRAINRPIAADVGCGGGDPRQGHGGPEYPITHGAKAIEIEDIEARVEELERAAEAAKQHSQSFVTTPPTTSSPNTKFPRVYAFPPRSRAGKAPEAPAIPRVPGLASL
jgi:hypothetical protein